MVLLCLPYIQNVAKCLFYFRCKDIPCSGILHVLFDQPDRVAQGINLILSLPVPRIVFCQVFLPAVSVVFFVKCIGIRINMYILCLTGDQPFTISFKIGYSFRYGR